MTTLVIHPKDKTTDFLSAIYSDIKDYTLVDDSRPNKEMKRLIKSHDRVIFLGHGSDYGLFDFSNNDYLIDKSYVYLLRGMKNNVYIWCNADVFVKRYKLSGFYTGMIISDVNEAELYMIEATNEEIDVSNINFANTIKGSINLTPELMAENVKAQYGTESNNIIDFNKKNIFCN